MTADPLPPLAHALPVCCSRSSLPLSIFNRRNALASFAALKHRSCFHPSYEYFDSYSPECFTLDSYLLQAPYHMKTK
jgi:hypothetical protein